MTASPTPCKHTPNTIKHTTHNTHTHRIAESDSKHPIITWPEMLLASGAANVRHESYSDTLAAEHGSEGGLTMMDTWLSDVEHAFERTPGSIKRREIMAVKQKEDLGAMWSRPRVNSVEDADSTHRNETRNSGPLDGDASSSPVAGAGAGAGSPISVGARLKHRDHELAADQVADSDIRNSGGMSPKNATSASEEEDGGAATGAAGGALARGGSARTVSSSSGDEARGGLDRKNSDSRQSNGEGRGEVDALEGLDVATGGDKAQAGNEGVEKDASAAVGEDAAGKEVEAGEGAGGEYEVDVSNTGARDVADDGRDLSPSQNGEIDRVGSESEANDVGHGADAVGVEEEGKGREEGKEEEGKGREEGKAERAARSDDDGDDDDEVVYMHVCMCVCV
jgi:hypothetical protein